MKDISKAESMLFEFYTLAPKLHSLDMCTHVTHSLIHLTKCVRNLGPLRCYSMFEFESTNEHSSSWHKKQFRSVDIFFYQVKRLLPYEREALVQLEKSLKAINYLEQCTKKGDKTAIAFVVGKIKHAEIDNNMCTCLREAGATITGSELLSFGKLKSHVQFFIQLYLQNSLKYMTIQYVSTATLVLLIVFGSIQLLL